MNKKSVILFGLALGVFIGIGPAQVRHVALVDEYSNLAGHIEEARSAFQRGDLAACEKEAQFCLEKVADHHEAHFLIGQVLYKRGEFQKALERAKAAEVGFARWAVAVADLRQPPAHEQGDRLASLSDDVRAAEEAESAALGKESYELDRLTKATRDAKAKLSAVEKAADAEAAADGGTPLQILPIPANYHYFHGNCFFMLKRMPEAEAAYRLALKTDPDYGEPYNNLINLLFMERRLDEARALLAQAESHKAVVSPGLKKAVLEKSGK
jgi:tetratricopeptide (TPR) repeat protein